MSLRTQITADDAVYFNTGDFADSATYTDALGNTTSVTVVSEGETIQQRQDEKGIIQVRENRFHLKISEAASPQVNGTITHDGVVWPIVGLDGKDHASVTVVCELPSSNRRSRSNYQGK